MATNDKITCEIVDVTPDMAKAWLGSNVQNRKISQWRVNLYAAAMERGEWFVINQGVGFDDKGNLLDGQNRLWAIAQSKATVRMLVVRGLDKRSQIVIDLPLVRRAHDQLHLAKGYDVTARHVAVARRMLYGAAGRQKNRVDLAQDIILFERFYTKHHKAIEFAVDLFAGKNIKRVTVAPVMAVIARAYYTVETERLRTFAEVLQTGFAAKKRDQAAIALRNWLLVDRRDVSSTPRILEVYRRTVQALESFVADEPVVKLASRAPVEDSFALPGTPRLVKQQAQAV